MLTSLLISASAAALNYGSCTLVFEPGSIVQIKNLKPERRNNSTVRQRARMMSHSFGIIMNPPIQINTQNAKEVRVRWIGNDSIVLGIN